VLSRTAAVLCCTAAVQFRTAAELLSKIVGKYRWQAADRMRQQRQVLHMLQW
jgi:hypothetical protein